MKKYIFLILIIFIVSCEKPQNEIKYKTYCLKIELVTGKIKEIKVRAPENSTFTINSHKGSYWLDCESGYLYSRRIRAGVIDFEMCP